MRGYRPARHERLSTVPRLLLVGRRISFASDDAQKRHLTDAAHGDAGRCSGQAALAGRDQSEVCGPARVDHR